MGDVLKSTWALLLGVLLLMLGNGLQGTLLGIRGAIEGFSTWEMSLIMSAYFLGFFGGSRMTPEMIRRVGHIRVFAALGSFISAVLILYPTVAEPWAWVILRVIIGFSFSGVYITAESWLNNAASNENRGKSLSLYLIVQMLGIVTAQGFIALGDPSGFVLFVIPSVLVSLAFAPILLSVNPTPAFDSAKAMTLRQLYQVSPLGVVGIFLLGGIFAAQFGMGSVYATQAGMSLGEISVFIATIYTGALVLQYPIGWISDRMDRRILVASTAAIGGLACLIGVFSGGNYAVLLGVAFMTGGVSNPLYSLLLAYTNDFLDHDDMASASAGLIFVNGLGAIAGPVVTGRLMDAFGPGGFWVFIGILMVAIAVYAVYRMTQRRGVSVEDTGGFVAVSPSSSVVTMEAAQEWAQEIGGEDHENNAS